MTTATPAVGVPFDLAASPFVQRTLPGLGPALDAAAAAAAIERSAVRAGTTVERCRPGKALYLGDEGCSLRYDLELRDARGQRQRALLLGRVLPDDEGVRRYHDAAAAVAARVDDGGLLLPHAALPGRLVVHAFPVDPEIPTLVDAVNPAVVGSAVDGFAAAEATLVHYGRRERCVLRYDRGDGGEPKTVYGKVWSDDRGQDVCDAVRHMAGRLGPARVPGVYGYLPEVRLALFEALAGDPTLTGHVVASPDAQRHVDDAAAVAAALHGGDVPGVVVRTIETELDELGALVAMMRVVTPDLAQVFADLLARITEAAQATEALPLVPIHGDFTPSQLIGDGASCGVVDFDSVGRGEAALDLGQYQAYVRLAAAKAGAPVDTADELCRRFMATYATAASGPADAVDRRTRVYVCVSLCRTSVHAWQKLKPKRAATVFEPLTREVASLTPEQRRP